MFKPSSYANNHNKHNNLSITIEVSMNSSLKTRRFPRDQWLSIIAEKKGILGINFIQFLETEFFAS